jgi:hypothetical protein
MHHHMEDIMVYFAHKKKIWQSGFYWPTMYKDTKDFIRPCHSCQKHEGISALPLTYNLQVELFDVWGIDYMGPFPKSHNCEYILVAVDYISKWVEAMPCREPMLSIPRRCSKKLSFQGLEH